MVLFLIGLVVFRSKIGAGVLLSGLVGLWVQPCAAGLGGGGKTLID